MRAKRDYYRNVFHKYSSNLKKKWQIINESLNRQKGSSLLYCTLLYGTLLYTWEEGIATKPQVYLQ